MGMHGLSAMTCAHDWQLRADWSVLCARCGVERDREAGDLIGLPDAAHAPPEPPQRCPRWGCGAERTGPCSLPECPPLASPLERAVRESAWDRIGRKHGA